MKLTILNIFEAYYALDRMISSGDRNMNQKAKYRLARFFRKLTPEFELIVEQRDTKIKSYGFFAPQREMVNGVLVDKKDENDGVILMENESVPPDKTKDFTDWWRDFSRGEVVVSDVDPIPFAMIDLGDDENGSLTVGDLVALGALVGEP